MTTQPFENLEQLDPAPEMLARQVITRMRDLLERAQNARNLSEDDRRWFFAPPLMPDHAETVRRAVQAVKAIAHVPPTTCREPSCGALLYLVPLRDGTTRACDPDGTKHFMTCRAGKRSTGP